MFSRIYLYRDVSASPHALDTNSYYDAGDIFLDSVNIVSAFNMGDSITLSGHGNIIAANDTAWYHLVVDMDSATLAYPLLNYSWAGVEILERRIGLLQGGGILYGPEPSMEMRCAITYPNAFSIIVDNEPPACDATVFNFKDRQCDDACDEGFSTVSLADSILLTLDFASGSLEGTDTNATGWPKAFLQRLSGASAPVSMKRHSTQRYSYPDSSGVGIWLRVPDASAVNAPTELVDGFYQVFETKDAAGNVGRCSTQVIWAIDTRKPAVAGRPNGFTLSTDLDKNGVVNPGDIVTLSVDMSNEPLGEICAVTAILDGWYLSPLKIVLADVGGNRVFTADHAVSAGILIAPAGTQRVQIHVMDKACNVDSLAAVLSADVNIVPPDIIWVDTTGNDVTGDGTISLPFRTIQKAMEVVPAGKTIMVRPGTYGGPVMFRNDRSVRLVSEQGPFVTTITGTIIGGGSEIVMPSSEDTLELNGFTIRGQTPTPFCAYCAGGVLVEYPTYARIIGNIVADNQGQSVSGATAATGGIAFYGSDGLIANNWIVNNVGNSPGSAGGLLLRDDSRVQIVNNTIVGNSNLSGSAAAGVYVIDANKDGWTDRLFLDNNIIAFNSPGSGFVGMTLATGGGAAWARNNLYYNNADPNAYPPGIPSASWIFADPLLLEVPKRDCHLTCVSPARGTGRLLSVPDSLRYDIDGNENRTTGGKVDIGADQFYDADKHAIFYPNDTTGCATGAAPFTVVFINHSTCIDENWLWDFGDKGMSTLKNPMHAYSSAGDYSVRLIAWGEKDADTALGTIHVAGPVSANFSAPTTTGCRPFDATLSATPNDALLRYIWEFGDGDVDSSGSVVTHRYDSAGAWTVRLRVRNACGTDTVVKAGYITVKSPPVVTITSDWVDPPTGPVCNPHTVKFGYTSDQKITAFSWDFGDNHFSSDSTPSHTYVDAGTFGVQLLATGQCGTVPVVKRDYITLVARPTAVVSATPLFVCSGQNAVRCSAAVSGTYTSTRWFFGDGDSADGLVVSHAYAGIRRYLPRLVFTHICGTDTIPLGDSLSVGDSPVAVFAVAPDSGYEPFVAAFTDQSANLPNGWSWNFGDNGTSGLQNPTHIYAPGVFQAGMISQNPCGADTTALRRIVVGGLAAVIVDSLGTAGDTILYSVRVDTLVIPYDHTVTLSARLTTRPRRGGMGFAFSNGSGLPPLASMMRAIPTRDLAAGDYTVEFVATDSARTSDLQVPISKVTTRGLHYLAQPLLRIDPFPLAMDSTPIGFPISKTVTITNTASTIQGYRVVVQAATTSGPPISIPAGSGSTLAPQQHLTWTVEFSPLQKRDFAGWIRLRSDDPASTDTLIPVTGRGIGEQTPPRVTQTQPLQGSESAIDEPVRFEFSEAMVSVPLDTILTVRSKRADAAVSVHTQWVGTALSVSADDWFRPDDTITVSLKAMITDTNGNRLDGNGNGIEDGPPVDDYRLVFLTGPGVYPGDADRDGSVSEADLLPLARFYWLTGPSRSHQYPGFTLQPATSFTPREATHADADGNGQIDSADICPIAEFFGRDAGLAKTHVETWLAETKQWSDGVIEALLAALVDCPGEPIGRETLRRLLEDTRTTKGPRVPRDFALDQNYPNPFNPTTVIIYELPRRSEVHLEIFDILGRRVAVLAEGTQEAGRYQRLWDGRDDSGGSVGSGIYFYRLVTADFQQTRKMVLLK